MVGISLKKGKRGGVYLSIAPFFAIVVALIVALLVTPPSPLSPIHCGHWWRWWWLLGRGSWCLVLVVHRGGGGGGMGWVVWVERNKCGSGLGDVARHVIQVGTCCSNWHDFTWASGSAVKHALLQPQEVRCSNLQKNKSFFAPN